MTTTEPVLGITGSTSTKVRHEGSYQSQAITRIVRVGVKPILDTYGRFSHMPIPWPYALLSKMVELAAPRHAGVHVHCDTIGQAKAMVTTPKKNHRKGVIFYIHGGALLVCSPSTHQRMIGHLAEMTGMTVIAPSYPMIHRTTVPNIIEHVMTAYRDVCARYDKVVVAGDSAGGYLSLAVLAAARKEGCREPERLALFSPVSNLDTRETVSQWRESGLSDPMFSVRVMRSMALVARAHRTQRHELALDWDTLTSPGYQNPPILVQCATREMLSVDARYIVDRMGDSATLDSDNRMSLHVFQALCEAIPESMQALRRASRFLRYGVL